MDVDSVSDNVDIQVKIESPEYVHFQCSLEWCNWSVYHTCSTTNIIKNFGRHEGGMAKLIRITVKLGLLNRCQFCDCYVLHTAHVLRKGKRINDVYKDSQHTHVCERIHKRQLKTTIPNSSSLTYTDLKRILKSRVSSSLGPVTYLNICDECFTVVIYKQYDRSDNNLLPDIVNPVQPHERWLLPRRQQQQQVIFVSQRSSYIHFSNF